MTMSMDDLRYFDGKFEKVRQDQVNQTTKIHEKIDHETAVLHTRLTDHLESDLLAFGGLKEVMARQCPSVKEHEEKHHAVGWPKWLAIIIAIVGMICGILALLK